MSRSRSVSESSGPVDGRPRPDGPTMDGMRTDETPGSPAPGDAGRGPGDDPGHDADYRPDPRRWTAFSVCLVAGFMSLLDVSIVNVALPAIRDGVDASESQLQWVVSGYALAFGLVLVASGRLGDVRGRKQVFVAGLVLFTVASALCGLAPNAETLVAARLLQGVAGGILNPQVSGFVQQLFRGAERGRAFGFLGATIGLSTAVGPLTGGALIAAFGPEHGWRAVFFVNVPVGVVAVVLALRLLPSSTGPRRRESLDPVGVALLGAAVLALLLPLVQERSWPGAGKWLLVPLGLALLVAFVLWERRFERRGGQPTVSLDLFRMRSYALGASLGLVYFGGFTAIFFILALYLQSGEGYSAFEAGLAVTPFALGSALTSALGGRVVTRVGRPLVAGGLAAVVVGLVATDVVIGLVADGTLDVPVGWAIALPLLVGGLGSGLVISPNITLTLSQVPVERAGSAGGVLQTGQRIGAAVGIAVVGAVFFGTLAGSRGDWTAAVRDGLWVSVGVVAVALLLALADLRHDRRAAAPQRQPAVASSQSSASSHSREA